jgi:hypothetical protein
MSGALKFFFTLKVNIMCPVAQSGLQKTGRDVCMERMRRMKAIKLTMVCLLLGVAGMGSAWAGGGHHHNRTSVGIMIGPYWGPSYYSPFPYYYPPYYPPVVIERQAPQVYIEQQQAPAPPAPTAAAPINYWYYCAATNGYYPYVKECRGGWQKVLPQPPGQH